MSPDIDGIIVDNLAALRQRVVQRILWRLGSWFLRRTGGLDYALIQGHQTTASLATSTITDTIRQEGGVEITDIRNVRFTLDPETRVYRYSCECSTIYGIMPISTDIA